MHLTGTGPVSSWTTRVYDDPKWKDAGCDALLDARAAELSDSAKAGQLDAVSAAAKALKDSSK